MPEQVAAAATKALEPRIKQLLDARLTAATARINTYFHYMSAGAVPCHCSRSQCSRCRQMRSSSYSRAPETSAPKHLSTCRQLMFDLRADGNFAVTDDMASRQIDVLNQAFAPANFEFVLSGLSKHVNPSW